MTDLPAARRRSREDLETLAREFVAAPGVEPLSRRATMAVMAVATLTVVVLAAGALWPHTDEPSRDNADARAAAMHEAELLKQRIDAQRERAKARASLNVSTEYLDRMAKDDQAVLREMSARAKRLTELAAAPRPAEAAAKVATPEPTPKALAPARAPAPAQVAKAEPAAPSAPAHAEPAPAAPAPAAATPTAASPTAAAAPAASCSIHVADLSESGKLTFADVARMKGARLDEKSGHVFTPPVSVSGRQVVFEVQPDGCVKIVRNAR